MKTKEFMRIMLAVLLILGNGVLSILSFGGPAPVETIEIPYDDEYLDLKELLGEPIISLSCPVPYDMDLSGHKDTLITEKVNKELIVVHPGGYIYEYPEIPNPVFISNPVVSTKYGFFDPQRIAISTLESDDINPNVQRAVVYISNSYPVILDQKNYRFISDPAWTDIDGNGDPEIIVVTGFVMDNDDILVDGTIKDEAIIGFNATIIKDDFQETYEIDLTEVQYGDIKEPIISPQLSISKAINPNTMVMVKEEEGLLELEEDLVAYWNMDETSGTRYDSSGNNNDLLDVNTVGYDTGYFGNAAKLEAANEEYLYIPDENQAGLHITGDITASTWANITSYPKQGFVIAARMSGSSGENVDYAFYIEGGSIQSWNGSSNVYGNTPVPSGSWCHVAFVRSGNYITFYLDGQNIGSFYQEFNSTIANCDLYIGNNALSAYGNGMIDEVGIWSRALTEGEIIDVMNGKLAGYGYEYEEYSATGAMVGVTLFGTELYALSFADTDLDGYPEGGGVVKGFPVSDDAIAIGQPAFTPDGNLVVNAINDEGIPTTKCYSPGDNGGYSEYEWQVSQSAIKCGNISLSDFDNNGIPHIISPFQIGDTVEAKVFNPGDLSMPVTSVTWDSPNFSPDYFEVFPMELLIDGELEPVTFYLLGDAGYSANNEYEVIFGMLPGEIVIGREIADIEGSGKPQMAVVTDSGCIYPYEFGEYAPPSPLRTYPMHGWVPPSAGTNHGPVIEVDIMNDTVTAGQEKLIAQFIGIDADPCDILHYSASDNAEGECNLEFNEGMWELWYQSDTEGNGTITIEVSDIIATALHEIEVTVEPEPVQPDPPLNPSIIISGPLVTETPLEEKFTKYKYAWIRLHPSAEGENMQMKIGVDPDFTQSYTVYEYGQGWVDVAPHWEDFKNLKFVKLPELDEDGVKTFYVKFTQEVNGLVSEETDPAVFDSITLDTKAPELSADVATWFQSADVTIDGITTHVDTHYSTIYIWGEFSDENLKTPVEDSLEVIGGLPGMNPPADIEYTYYDEWEGFDVTVTLNEGQNGFKLVASDKAGNQTERRFEVDYSPLPDLVIEDADIKSAPPFYKLISIKVRNQGGGDMPEGLEVPVVGYGYEDDSFWFWQSDTLLYKLPYNESATPTVEDIPAGGYQWVHFLVTWSDYNETDYWKFYVDPGNILEEAYIFDDPDNITWSWIQKNNNGYYLKKPLQLR